MEIRVWWSHYLFFLTTISIIYPKQPSTLIKKKYYELITSLPIYFIPTDEHSKFFEKMLNLYPITSYLDNKESLCRWVWFLNNRVNEYIEKPKITLDEFYLLYYEHYKPDVEINAIYYKIRKRIVWILVISILLGISVYNIYHKLQ